MHSCISLILPIALFPGLKNLNRQDKGGLWDVRAGRAQRLFSGNWLIQYVNSEQWMVNRKKLQDILPDEFHSIL